MLPTPLDRASLFALLLLGACGAGEPALPEDIEIAAPVAPIRHVETVENLSEEVADRYLDLSAALRAREFGKVRGFFADDFSGHALAALPVTGTETLALDVERERLDAGAAPVVGADALVAGLSEVLGPWRRVESVLWKTKGAEFQAGGRPRWGKVKLWLQLLGEDASGAPTSVTGWAWSRVEKRRGVWVTTHLQLVSLERTRRAAPIFENVTTAAGVGYTGARFGKAGNRSYHFDGVAAGDVDGDGRWDLFVPSRERGFLYVARPDGTFADEAAARGLGGEARGAGCVFLDWDRDGDQDLFVAHEGWTEVGGRPGGRACRLYANDGEGRFTDVSASVGLDGLRRAFYSVSAFDYDLDGWVDLFLCAYGRLEAEHNDSWLEATNGQENALLRNVEGRRLEDVSRRAGITGRRWSYASAAADYDADGDLDLYVANDYGSNRLYRNEGDGTFVDVAPELGVTDRGNGMGVAWGDLDADGALDLYVSNMSSTAGNRILGRLEADLAPDVLAGLRKLAAGNSIFRRTGAGFEPFARELGGTGAAWAWSPALADLDLDGRLDVFVTNGFVTGDLPQDT